MATSTALKDATLIKVINAVVKGSTVQRLVDKGWHPDLVKLAAELSTWWKALRKRCHGANTVMKKRLGQSPRHFKGVIDDYSSLYQRSNEVKLGMSIRTKDGGRS